MRWPEARVMKGGENAGAMQRMVGTVVVFQVVVAAVVPVVAVSLFAVVTVSVFNGLVFAARWLSPTH